MGRLIDAEKITEVDCRGLEGYVKPEHYEIVASFFFEKFINCQPTAYDVDKVVAELEDKLYESSSAHAEAVMGMCGVSASGYSGEISAYGKAIEIVRKGGVNENS